MAKRIRKKSRVPTRPWTIRLTEAELAAIRADAERLGQKPTPLARKRVIDPGAPEVSAAALADLRHYARALIDVGRNINQIARHLNAGYPERITLDAALLFEIKANLEPGIELIRRLIQRERKGRR